MNSQSPSLRGAQATKQSIATGFATPMDCFAPLAMTKTFISVIQNGLSGMAII
jgi:hypothetical protein